MLKIRKLQSVINVAMKTSGKNLLKERQNMEYKFAIYKQETAHYIQLLNVRARILSMCLRCHILTVLYVENSYKLLPITIILC